MRKTDDKGNLKCTICKEWQEPSNFNRNKANNSGLEAYCRGCAYIKSKYHYLNHKKDYRAYSKRWRDTHPLQYALIMYNYWAKKVETLTE